MRMAPDTADLSVLLSVRSERETFLFVSGDLSFPSPLRSRLRLTQVVPDVHLSAQSPHFNDGLTQEVVALAFEPLLDPRFDVVVFVPHADLDSVRRVVAFAG